MNKKVFKTGDILSETQFYTVDGLTDDFVELINDEGNLIKVSVKYAEKFLTSATNFEKITNVTRTELIEKVLNSPRIAMSVNFNKKVDKKDIKNALYQLYPNKGKIISEVQFNKNVNNALSLTGEERTMCGRHYGKMLGTGRLAFIDMEVKTGIRERQVDPRTLNWAIIDGVKYQVK